MVERELTLRMGTHTETGRRPAGTRWCSHTRGEEDAPFTTIHIIGGRPFSRSNQPTFSRRNGAGPPRIERALGDLSASALRRVPSPCCRAPLINPVAIYLPRYSGALSYGEPLTMQVSKSHRRAIASSESHGRKQRELRAVHSLRTPVASLIL